MKKSAFQIFFLFLAPLTPFAFLPSPQEEEWVHQLIHGLIIVWAIVLLIIIIHEKWTWKDLGIRTDNFRTSILPYTFFTFGGVAVIFIFAAFLHHTTVENWWTYPHFQYQFITTSILQEFIFRSFLMKKLADIFSAPIYIIGTNALLFAIVHTILPEALLLFPLGILSGIAFATIYYWYPNLLLISISHMILNFFTVLHCFFSVSIQC